jgi:branched-chain amino acid transport system permease protein
MRFPYDTSYRDYQRLLRYPDERVSDGLLIVLLLALPWVLPVYFVGEASYLLILCVASIGLMLLTGYTGQVSLGHAAFIAIGAYAHAWCLNHNVPFLISLPLAGAVSGLVGLVIGLPAIRVSGLYLAMVTLAFAIIIEHLAGRWGAVTGGFSGTSVPDPSILGLSLGSGAGFYYLCFGVLLLVLLGAINLTRGQIGRAFVGIRDSEAAAYSLGIWVAGYKVVAFVVSAFVTGIAGGLFAHYIQFITPEGFGLLLSMELVLMVVIGGLGSLRGAIFGALLIGLLPTFISQVKPLLPDQISKQFGLEIFVFGLVLAVFVLFEPLGLNGRWLKLKNLIESFPLYRKDTFRRGKSYMRSERYR